MEKRKSKHGNSKEEPKKKKFKKNKHNTTGNIEPSDVFVTNTNGKQTPAESKMKRTKTAKHKGKASHKKMERKKTEKFERKPVSMQNLLSEKLKIVQQNRLEKATETKTVKGEEVEEYDKTNDSNKSKTSDSNKSVATSIDNTITKSAETVQNMQKNKDKKRKQNIVSDSVEEANTDSMNTESQGDVEKEDDLEDPEKAAIRKKKREKRKQKKLEKERIKQQNKEKEGTAKTAAVDYLNQWKNSREKWKFLKVRQVWLLQNMYDQALIDEDSFEILLEYLEGLRGKSKEVTVAEAEKVLAKAETDEEGLSAVSLERARQIIQLLSDD